MRPYLFAIATTLLVFTSGSALYADSPADYANWRSLSADSKTELAAAIAPKAFRQLPAEQRGEIAKAALRFSEQVLGRQANGKLKAVKDEQEKHLLQIAGEYLDRLPPAKVLPHARADEFYGSIPADAERISRMVSIDPAAEQWHSTGLYAAPGEVITVKVPNEWTPVFAPEL